MNVHPLGVHSGSDGFQGITDQAPAAEALLAIFGEWGILVFGRLR